MFDVVHGNQLAPGSAVPAEWQDFMLLREMHGAVTWRDVSGLKRMPHYVTECFKHFLALVNSKG